MAEFEHIKRLFQAFRDQNDLVFYKTAEAIISEEQAANHHGAATDLQRAIGLKKEQPRSPTMESHRLSAISKNRRPTDGLITVYESGIDQTKIILSGKTKSRIDRVLIEHRKRALLERSGYQAKSKLLFWGPPGCGKTYTAKFIAHELGLPVGVVRLSSLISSFLGDTSSNLQRLFDDLNSRPMVLLIDEVDAVGKSRDDQNDVGELKRIVNTFLQAIDEFRAKESVLIAATNHQYLLDSALWRRFDDVIEFGLPDKAARLAYLKLALNGIRFSGSLEILTKSTAGLSFGEIEKVTTEAVKTMILNEADSLSQDKLLIEILNYNDSIQSAKGTKDRPKSRTK